MLCFNDRADQGEREGGSYNKEEWEEEALGNEQKNPKHPREKEE